MMAMMARSPLPCDLLVDRVTVYLSNMDNPASDIAKCDRDSHDPHYPVSSHRGDHIGRLAWPLSEKASPGRFKSPIEVSMTPGDIGGALYRKPEDKKWCGKNVVEGRLECNDDQRPLGWVWSRIPHVDPGVVICLLLLLPRELYVD